jgi:hypothetical protein
MHLAVGYSHLARAPNNVALRIKIAALERQRHADRGMNIAADAAREYIKQAGRTERPWPAHVARLVDANLSLMGQRIITRVRRLERDGKPEQAEVAFHKGMQAVGIAAAEEYLTNGCASPK